MNEQQLLAHPAVVEALAAAETDGFARAASRQEGTVYELHRQNRELRRILWAVIHQAPHHEVRIAESTLMDATREDQVDGRQLIEAHDPVTAELVLRAREA
jgi:hypothetical protein